MDRVITLMTFADQFGIIDEQLESEKGKKVFCSVFFVWLRPHTLQSMKFKVENTNLCVCEST